MLRLILLGPQGSGKGTQAGLLGKKFGIPQISTGNALRENIEKGTELGRIAKRIMDEGRLVSDDIVNRIVESRLRENDAKKGFMLDGYPRNIPQAEFLSKIGKIDAVIEIEVPDAESIRRISGRRTCKCGAVYHTFYNPPAVPGICDRCGGKLFQRDDDKEEAIRERLAIYHNETEPIIRFYSDRHIKINGEQPIEKVFEDILAGLKKRNLAK
jgi:adenylate kinase